MHREGCFCRYCYESIKKPPLGIMPRKLHEEYRLGGLNEAIRRYLEAGLEIPTEWVEERNELLARIQENS